jgi:class 3 adenylate cyclase
MADHMEAIRRLQAQAAAVEQREVKTDAEYDDYSDAVSAASSNSNSYQTQHDSINTSGGSGGKGDAEHGNRRKKPFDLVQKETSTVMCLRYFILLQVLVMGSLFGYGTFAYVEKAIENDPETDSNMHIILTAVVSGCFLILLVTFLVYDYMVEKRQAIVVNIATKSSAIVDGLFPEQVRDRMLNVDGDKGNKDSGRPGTIDMGGHVDPVSHGSLHPNTNKTRGTSTALVSVSAPGLSVKQFLAGNGGSTNVLSTQPIADLFPNTTVIFADIAGFTAWSSQRDPPQVFTLLETLYRSFDELAGKFKVFKVETIGDSYMAVTGLPVPDASHAVHMARFGYQCLVRMKKMTGDLEALLGPGTSELGLRIGLHSGACTGGVLRGEKSRFQLFGDTVNTASRMESTGKKGRIQISQETAILLKNGGKSHWLKAREELVNAKGKGELRTYWLDPANKRRAKTSTGLVALGTSGNVNGKLAAENPFDDKDTRLIDWNVDVLLHHLARVISCRGRAPTKGSLVNHTSEVSTLPSAIEDVAEIIALPPFDLDTSRFRRIRPDVSTLQQTRADLHEYVSAIALMYRDVPFHNFEHASHVTLCANKLLNRLINSDEYETEEELHDATYGISSDPLAHFAIVFSALIHDVDHTGLPNAQLVKDQNEVAVKFKNKSVAEQNSTHIGWQLLMNKRFERLRKCIYQTNVERKRFRQLVINSIMATDIADRKANENREMKWERAFRKVTKAAAKAGTTPMQIQENTNRKATAVIEHIIQVSDVAHTMQHWHIYQRWNERLFNEMHNAFKQGKVAVDPSTNWYIGEIGFFDYYLIPLAMKLKECGVFGASGYEYASYVLKNKKEWERKGQQSVKEMVVLYKGSEGSGSSDFDSFISLDDDESYDSDDLEYDSN